MPTVWDTAIAEVLEAEGILADDPNDSGGLTKYGISSKAYPNLDVGQLTKQEAIDIYRRDYWLKTGSLVEDLDPELAIALFDYGVNSGPETAVMALQKALGVAADGKVGPKTRAAIEGAKKPTLLVNFLAGRLQSMTTFKSYPVHGRGWFRRVVRLTYQLGRYSTGQDCTEARQAIEALVRTARALGIVQ